MTALRNNSHGTTTYIYHLPSSSTIVITVCVIGPGRTSEGVTTTATKFSFPSRATSLLIMVKLVHCVELLEDAGKVTWLVSASKSSDSMHKCEVCSVDKRKKREKVEQL